MQDFQNLETAVLLDMLSMHTVSYTKMLTDNLKGEEFFTCETVITQIQNEINSRKYTSGNITLTGLETNFTTNTTE